MYLGHWQLLKECAEQLTREGKIPFSRKDLIDCIKKTHPDKKEDSINPMIQGITVNLKGGAPGGVGKNILYKVESDRFVLYDPQKHSNLEVEIKESPIDISHSKENKENLFEFYKKFYDPTEKFKQEPRYFCYEIATELIKKAQKMGKNWYEDENTLKGILLLLFCWNFAAKQTKKLKFENLKEVLVKCKKKLQFLEEYSIEDLNPNNKELKKAIEEVYKEFKNLMGQTGASKALSLLNPKLFVMWDTKIRRFLKEFIKNIENGEKPEHYYNFLLGIKKIILEFNLQEKIPQNSIIAKKIDEYHYVEIVMKDNS